MEGLVASSIQESECKSRIWKCLIFVFIFGFTSQINSECLGVINCRCQTPIDSDPVINCRNSQLETIPTFTDSITHYQELTLEGNGIKNIQDGAFGRLIVNTINLKGNPIVHISSNAFLGIEGDLKALIIGLDQTASFPTQSLSGLINLKSLQIHNFGQSSLPDDAFNKLAHLEDIAIVNGKLSSFSGSSLNVLDQLHSLALDSNRFDAVPNVSRIRTLRKFSITKNLIRSLNVDSFSSSSIIEDVDLSGNILGANIDPKAFITLGNVLKYLTLTTCELTDTSLQSLMMIKSLITLNIQSNNIANLPDRFLNNLTNLLQLNLAQNQISKLQVNIFKSSLVPLMNLDLSSNPLAITSSIAFTSLASLESLVLRSIQSIQLYPRAFEPMQKTLKRLDLSNTPADATVFQELPLVTFLQELNLSSCSLTSLSDLAFKNNVNLRTLDLSHNKLSSLSTKVFQGLEKSLTYLNLNSNGLTTLDRCTMGNLQSLDILKFSLDGNQIKCDCRVQWLFNKIKTQDESYLSRITWKCNTGELFTSMAATFSKCPVAEGPCLNWVNDNNTSNFQPLVLEIKKLTGDSADLQWSVSGTKVIYGFIITYGPSVANNSKSIRLPSTSRDHVLSDLNPSTNYYFCIILQTSLDWTYESQNCKSGQTTASTNNNLLGPILGGVLGGLAFVTIIVVAIIVCCILSRRKPKASDSLEKTQSVTLDDSYSSGKAPSHIDLAYHSRAIPPSPVGPPPDYSSNIEKDDILSFMLASTASKPWNSVVFERGSQKSSNDLNNSAFVQQEMEKPKRKKRPKRHKNTAADTETSMENNGSIREAIETTV